LSIKNQAIAGVKWTTIATATKTGSGLLKIAILARFLDKSDFGLMAIVLFVMGFAELFLDMGLSTAILHKQNITREQYGSLYWANFLFSLCLFAALWALAIPIANFYDEPELRTIVPIMASAIILSACGRQFRTIAEKHLEFRFIALVTIAGSILALAVATVLAVRGYGVYALVFGALTQHLVTHGTFFFRGITKIGLMIRLKVDEVKPFFRIGLYHVGGQIINYFNRDLDILIVGKLFGSEILGGYSLAKELVFRPIKVVNPILTRVASPLLAKMQHNKEELRKNYLKLVNTVATINIPIFLLTIVAAPLIVRILYGPEFLDIVTLVRILSVYVIFRSIGNPVISLIVATGRTDLNFVWNLVTLAIMPLAVFIGGQFSIEGVAISQLIAILLLFVPNWWFLIRKMIDVKLTTYMYWIIPGVSYLRK